MGKLFAKTCLLAIFIVFINGCASSNLKSQSTNSYSIERYQSADRTYLSLNCYHFDNKNDPIPAFFHINGIIFGPSDNYQNRIIPVMPGTYNIKSGFVGKELLNAKIEMERNDSVVVEFYLKDSSEPLYSIN